MHIKDWKKEVFTIPNLLSLFRLALIPVYAHIYLGATERRQFLIAGLILAISCLTDLIDGKIARRFNMISTLGKILDPIADKLTQFVLTFCLSLEHPELRPVLVLFVVSGVVLTGLGLYEPLVRLAGAGATTPLTGFGYALGKGAIDGAMEDGLIGAFTGGIKATAGGVAAAIVFGALNAAIFTPKTKK